MKILLFWFTTGMALMAESGDLSRYYEKCSQRQWLLGQMIVDHDGISDKDRVYAAKELAASAFHYFILVKEGVHKKQRGTEMIIKQSLKSERIKTAFDDPLSWISELRRMIGDGNYPWEKNRDRATYGKYVAEFKTYFEIDP